MYKILVVDHEPSSVKDIQNLVELKGEGYEVSGTASNGVEAVQWLENNPVDVVITDVRMPVDYGTELVSYIQEHLSNVFCVVVSGYRDFDFVRCAIHAGVYDYLLKPVDPEEIQKLFGQIRQKLDENYYIRRGRIVHQLKLHSAEEVDWKELSRIFPAKRYYAAIIHRSGRAFGCSGRTGQELFHKDNENVFLPDGDETERLYVCDEEQIVYGFSSMMNREFMRLKEEGRYLTMVICEDAFSIHNLPRVIEGLYLTLDRSIVIGLNQTIPLNRARENFGSSSANLKFQHLLYLIHGKDFGGMLLDMEELFGIWEKEVWPEYLVKEKIRYLFYEMQNDGMLANCDESLFDNAFFNVMNMKELYGNIAELLRRALREKTGEWKFVKEEVYQQIVSYLQYHPSERLSVKDICSRFEISQATLNRMFRSYAQMSYSSYLTAMRIRISRELLEKKPDSYIKDIAEAVGYNDQFYFSRIFRTVTGMSPTEYVKKTAKKKAGNGKV